jgi:hypothetical protein
MRGDGRWLRSWSQERIVLDVSNSGSLLISCGIARTTPIIWPPGLYSSDREPREHSLHDVEPARRHAGRLNLCVLEGD